MRMMTSTAIHKHARQLGRGGGDDEVEERSEEMLASLWMVTETRSGGGGCGVEKCACLPRPSWILSWAADWTWQILAPAEEVNCGGSGESVAARGRWKVPDCERGTGIRDIMIYSKAADAGEDKEFAAAHPGTRSPQNPDGPRKPPRNM